MTPRDSNTCTSDDGERVVQVAQASERCPEARPPGSAVRYRFRFRNARTGAVQFDRELRTARCAFVERGSETADKATERPDSCGQCSRWTTRLHPYCRRHTAQQFRVLVARSREAGDSGYGLFAHDPSVARLSGDRSVRRSSSPPLSPRAPLFRRGCLICPYGGELVDGEELIRRYAPTALAATTPFTAPYAILDRDAGLMVDAALVRGPGAYCNDARDASRVNVRFTTDGCGTFGIAAACDIWHGDELLADYGEDYWRDDGAPQAFETVRV
ncbi:Hypothetical protein UVM_LOCUS334 [uncultured virus]|nr:Hypothetical protein UVM_LOCUS334 [uncultured virus]